MLSEKELIDGQRWLACWEKVTSKPMTARETFFARAIEAAACAERDKRISELLANEKVLLAQIQGNTQWREKIIKASEQAYGESAVRYKFSLTKSGKCMNTFPKAIDGRWFALVPAEGDGHIGHVARIAELERELEEARKQMDAQKAEWLAWEAKRKALEKDAERWAHACKGSNKQINVCSWDRDAYEFVGYAMKKDSIDAIADAEIAAMKGTP